MHRSCHRIGLKWKLHQIVCIRKQSDSVRNHTVLNKRQGINDDTCVDTEIMITHDTDHRHICDCE